MWELFFLFLWLLMVDVPIPTLPTIVIQGSQKHHILVFAWALLCHLPTLDHWSSELCNGRRHVNTLIWSVGNLGKLTLQQIVLKSPIFFLWSICSTNSAIESVRSWLSWSRSTHLVCNVRIGNTPIQVQLRGTMSAIWYQQEGNIQGGLDQSHSTESAAAGYPYIVASNAAPQVPEYLYWGE